MAMRKNKWSVCRYGAHTDRGFAKKDCVYAETEKVAKLKAKQKKFPTGSPIYRFDWVDRYDGDKIKTVAGWELWGYLE
jgi:hypothetical protein